MLEEHRIIGLDLLRTPEILHGALDVAEVPAADLGHLDEDRASFVRGGGAGKLGLQHHEAARVILLPL